MQSNYMYKAKREDSGVLNGNKSSRKLYGTLLNTNLLPRFYNFVYVHYIQVQCSSQYNDNIIIHLENNIHDIILISFAPKISPYRNGYLYTNEK